MTAGWLALSDDIAVRERRVDSWLCWDVCVRDGEGVIARATVSVDLGRVMRWVMARLRAAVTRLRGGDDIAGDRASRQRKRAAKRKRVAERRGERREARQEKRKRVAKRFRDRIKKIVKALARLKIVDKLRAVVRGVKESGMLHKAIGFALGGPLGASLGGMMATAPAQKGGLLPKGAGVSDLYRLGCGEGAR
jgi:hypothetical protein